MLTSRFLRAISRPAGRALATQGDAAETQGEKVLEYWKEALMDDGALAGRRGEAAAAPGDQQVKQLLSTAIRLRQGRAQSTLPEQLIALFMEYYKRLDRPGQLALFRNLTRDFGVQRGEVEAAIAAWQQAAAAAAAGAGSGGGAGAGPGAAGEQAADALGRAAQRLAAASQPLYSRLFVPVSQQLAGIKFLADLRADLLECVRRQPAGSAPLRQLSEAIRGRLAEWFSVGLLQLRRLTWEHTSAALLEKVMEHEAVHRMGGWADLRQRLGPCRRVFAFFHQAMPEEPLVVLHTALVRGPPAASMQQIFAGEHDCADEPTTAVFYSISSTQPGLTGVDLGNFLIKQVAQVLLRELPTLATLATLSPMPGFAGWLDMRISRGLQGLDSIPLLLPAELARLVTLAEGHMPAAVLAGAEGPQRQAATLLQWCLRDDQWLHNPRLEAALQPVMLRLGAVYLVREKRRGLALDPVANFHLRNGAQLWRLNWRGDTSPAGLRRSHGLMCNYLYDLPAVHANNRAYLVDGRVVTSEPVDALLQQEEQGPAGGA